MRRVADDKVLIEEIEENILRISVKVKKMDLDAAKHYVHTRIRYCQEWNCSLVVLHIKPLKKVSREAREFFHSDLAYEGADALVVICENNVAIMLFKFYAAFRKAKKPTNYFRSEKEAIHWLKSLR